MKFTIPPAFGVIPRVIHRPVVNLRNLEAHETVGAIEFVPATPLEYLDRWSAANELFGDKVRLGSVVQWTGGQISFAIHQPQYHGHPASAWEIDSFFKENAWLRLPDQSGHLIYFNYGLKTLAIDAVERNCYLSQDGENLLPFDVVLCPLDDELAQFLKIYPI